MSKKCIQIAATKRAKAHVRCYNSRSKDEPSKTTGGPGGNTASPEKVGFSHDPRDYDSSTQAFKNHVTTDEQKDAVTYYTKEGYRPLNNCRRRNLMCDKVDYGKAMELNKLLTSAPKFEGEVYRGVEFSSKEKADAFISNFKKGGIYVDPGFMSTSTNKNIADQFKDSGNGGLGISLKIKSKNGAAIKSLSDIPSENEVLFGANSKFFVKNIKTGKNGYEIELENID